MSRKEHASKSSSIVTSMHDMCHLPSACCCCCCSAASTQGNYEFGISRVVKSLEPYSMKLSTDTWFYAKRCFLSLVDGLAKHMLPFKSESWEEVLGFLEEAEKVGRSIPASFAEAGGAAVNVAASLSGMRGREGATVASEARLLRALLLKLKQMY